MFSIADEYDNFNPHQLKGVFDEDDSFALFLLEVRLAIFIHKWIEDGNSIDALHASEIIRLHKDYSVDEYKDTLDRSIKSIEDDYKFLTVGDQLHIPAILSRSFLTKLSGPLQL